MNIIVCLGTLQFLASDLRETRLVASKKLDGAVVLTASEFARAEECMTNPGEPTEAAQRGAEMLRKLYRNQSTQR